MCARSVVCRRRLWVSTWRCPGRWPVPWRRSSRWSSAPTTHAASRGSRRLVRASARPHQDRSCVPRRHSSCCTRTRSVRVPRGRRLHPVAALVRDQRVAGQPVPVPPQVPVEDRGLARLRLVSARLPRPPSQEHSMHLVAVAEQERTSSERRPMGAVQLHARRHPEGLAAHRRCSGVWIHRQAQFDLNCGACVPGSRCRLSGRHVQRLRASWRAARCRWRAFPQPASKRFHRVAPVMRRGLRWQGS